MQNNQPRFWFTGLVSNQVKQTNKLRLVCSFFLITQKISLQAVFTDKLHERLNTFMDLFLLLKITFPTKRDMKH